jgi:hypothetical protein
MAILAGTTGTDHELVGTRVRFHVADDRYANGTVFRVITLKSGRLSLSIHRDGDNATFVRLAVPAS